jgi:type VI secretion system secreted protein Hcp
MSEQWFLKVDGIAGESSNDRHATEIDVEAWSFGAVAGDASSVGVGAGSARPTLEPFAFEARLSTATPALFEACVTGRHIRSATLTGVRTSGDRATDFVTYALRDVTVTSSRHGDDRSGAPFDRFTLKFRNITVTYTPQLPTGQSGPPVTVAYDP